MRDTISDKRAGVLKTCRNIVELEHTQRNTPASEAKQAFYARLLEDHAILSPDPSDVSRRLSYLY
jgi:hypothetical protein